jgi:hypothetical protein
MKRAWVVCLLSFAYGSLWAQQDTTSARPPVYTNYGREISISGAYVHISEGSGGEGSGFLTVTPRIGWFVWKGLEIEPEVYFVASSTGSLYYALNGNVSYNFSVQRGAVFFLLVGYGFGTLIPMGSLGGVGLESTMLGLVNIGGGLKIMAADNVAFRIEGRYIQATGEQSIDYGIGAYSYPTRSIDTRVLNILFGFSIFFGSR